MEKRKRGPGRRAHDGKPGFRAVLFCGQPPNPTQHRQHGADVACLVNIVLAVKFGLRPKCVGDFVSVGVVDTSFNNRSAKPSGCQAVTVAHVPGQTTYSKTQPPRQHAATHAHPVGARKACARLPSRWRSWLQTYEARRTSFLCLGTGRLFSAFNVWGKALLIRTYSPRTFILQRSLTGGVDIVFICS